MVAISLALLFTAATSEIVSAYVVPSSFTGSRLSRTNAPNRVDTKVYENFGLEFAEDQTENTAALLLGEANYKQWAGTVNKNGVISKQYNALRRIRELDLLGKTVDAGILSKLEKNGVDLATLESLLPTLEKLGALEVVGNNQQLLINLVAPLLIEGAPIALPLVAALLDVGPVGFYLIAAACFGSEYFLISNDVQIPLVGLPAGTLLGLLLIPLGLVTGVAGNALASTKK